MKELNFHYCLFDTDIGSITYCYHSNNKYQLPHIYYNITIVKILFKIINIFNYFVRITLKYIITNHYEK